MASSAELLKAVQLAARTLAGNGHIDTVLPDVLDICVRAVGAAGGTIYLHDERNKTLVFRHVLPESVRAQLQFENIPDDFGVAGQAFQSGKTQISAFPTRSKDDLNRIESQTGVQIDTMITVPLQMQDEPPIGVVQLINKASGAFDESDATVLDTVAAVATLAYLNAKLTDESTRAGTLLGMGKVSHDIGNLAASLFATIQFSTFAVSSLRTSAKDGETDAVLSGVDSIDDMLLDLTQSVERIVGYSRLISDLSAGRQLRPELQLASLGKTIEQSAAYLESEARNNRVQLEYKIQQDAPPMQHDALFVYRIVQNLVGNAIKAVRETSAADPSELGDGDWIGTVTVSYVYDGTRHVLQVRDSGPGMTKEIADRILSGNARSAWGRGAGSGWGSKIVLELAHSHEATVEIDSTLGAGSTFSVVFPNDRAS